MRHLTLSLLAASTLATVASVPAYGTIRITEFLSEGQGDIASGNGGRRQREFFELTNLGTTAVDTSAWSYNDNNANDPHLFGAPRSDAAYGPAITSIAPGESVIFTQMTASAFRALWNLPTSVQVYSYLQLSNLGNADTINIYNAATQDGSTLVDSLTYTSDARGSGISRNRPYDALTGQYPNAAWAPSTLPDIYGSFLSPNAPTFSGFESTSYAELANPGTYIPEPAALALLPLAALPLSRRRR